MAPRILIAVQDAAIAMLLNCQLEADGFEVEMASCCSELRHHIQDTSPDALVVDWKFIELCEMKSQYLTPPSISKILLTDGKHEIEHLIAGSVGADHILSKPFSIRKLSQLLTVLIRRGNGTLMDKKLVVGDIVLMRDLHLAVRAGKVVRLGQIDLQFLTFLMEQSGRVVTREQILDGVWGPCSKTDIRTVDVYVGRLRRALCHGRKPNPIRTVKGVGYILGSCKQP